MFMPSTEPFLRDIMEPRKNVSIIGLVHKIIKYKVVNHCAIQVVVLLCVYFSKFIKFSVLISTLKL